MSKTVLIAVLAVFAAAAVHPLLRHLRQRRRQRAVGQLLDAADALEDRLRSARSEIQAIAGDEVNPVREAMQEMLRHRLWLQQHGEAAPLAQIEQVRDSILAADARMHRQLQQLERARAQA